MAAGKKTGGRKKGSPNKVKSKLAAKVEVMEAAAAAGETPLDYMIRVMRDPTVDHRRRDAMAGQAAPYVHAKLASVTVAGDQDKPLNVVSTQSTAETARRIAFALFNLPDPPNK